MLYQLPNGGTIKIDESIYFGMSDAQFDRFISNMRGSEIMDPFHESTLLGISHEDDEISPTDLPEIDVDPKEFMAED